MADDMRPAEYTSHAQVNMHWWVKNVKLNDTCTNINFHMDIQIFIYSCITIFLCIYKCCDHTNAVILD